jgi:hypothetical protein
MREDRPVTGGDPLQQYLCLSVDVQSYGATNDVRQFEIQSELIGLLDEAGARSAVRRSDWTRQPKGDEELALVPVGAPWERVVGGFCLALADALNEHNATRGAERRLRLRLAMATGPVQIGRNGFAGRAVVDTSRLVGSWALRKGLSLAAHADLAVMLSHSVYLDWVHSGYSAAEPGWFRRVFVNEKEFREHAWLWVPGTGGRPPGEGDPGWEYLLLGGVVLDEMERLQAKRFDRETGYAIPGGPRLSFADVASFVAIALDELAATTVQIADLLGPARLAWAVGPSGEPGDASRIQHLAERFVATYEVLLDWAARIRGIVAEPGCRPLLSRLAELADGPLRGLDRFVEQLVDAGREIAGDQEPDSSLVIEVGLRIEVDPVQQAAFETELTRFAGAGLT